MPPSVVPIEGNGYTYTLHAETPPPKTYARLRATCNLGAPPADLDLVAALGRSVHCVVARARLNHREVNGVANGSANGVTNGVEVNGVDADANGASVDDESREDPRGEIVGMIRLVGDGIVFVHVHDVCVLPQHRRQGVGAMLVAAMARWIDEHASGAYVSLEADPGAAGMYAKSGFRVGKGTPMVRATWGV